MAEVDAYLLEKCCWTKENYLGDLRFGGKKDHLRNVSASKKAGLRSL